MQDITINLIAVVLLLATSAFFVATEFSLVKARGFRLESLAQEGRTSGQLTLSIQANPETGDRIIEDEFRFTVESLIENRVGQALIERHDDDSSNATGQMAD